MSTKTKKEVMVGMRKKYAHAGPEYRMKLIDQTVELLSCHRKSAIRALRGCEKSHLREDLASLRDMMRQAAT